jgi:hypothetical protein
MATRAKPIPLATPIRPNPANTIQNPNLDNLNPIRNGRYAIQNKKTDIGDRKYYTKKRFLAQVLLVVILFFTFLNRWLIGTYYYQYYYIRAALGDDGLQTACAGVKAVKNPWRNLGENDWYQLQACLGNEHGYERQGELFGLVNSSMQLLGVGHC